MQQQVECIHILINMGLKMIKIFKKPISASLVLFFSMNACLLACFVCLCTYTCAWPADEVFKWQRNSRGWWFGIFLGLCSSSTICIYIYLMVCLCSTFILARLWLIADKILGWGSLCMPAYSCGECTEESLISSHVVLVIWMRMNF